MRPSLTERPPGLQSPGGDGDRFYRLTLRGWKLIERLILFRDQAPRWRWRWRRRLAKAMTLYLEAHAIDGQHPGPMWALGKIYQRLGNHSEAFEWFARAYREAPDDGELAREACLSALKIGRHDDAIAYGYYATKARQDDPGLVANLALAYLLAGRVLEAKSLAEQAALRDAHDKISSSVVRLIDDVLSGRRTRPQNMRELDSY
jgi:tetratricopeptide (TPR) repeat protein